MGHLYAIEEEGLRTLQRQIFLYDKSRPFRFGDVTGFREHSYEIGTATVQKVEGNSLSDRIKGKLFRRENSTYRRIDTDLFSEGLVTKSCTPALDEIRKGDEIVYARAGNRTLALLDYRNPNKQKPVFVNDTNTEGRLQMQLLYNNAVFRLTVDKKEGNIHFSSNFVIARFNDPIILYHHRNVHY
jgi:hypothetical protein